MSEIPQSAVLSIEILRNPKDRDRFHTAVTHANRHDYSRVSIRRDRPDNWCDGFATKEKRMRRIPLASQKRYSTRPAVSDEQKIIGAAVDQGKYATDTFKYPADSTCKEDEEKRNCINKWAFQSECI